MSSRHGAVMICTPIGRPAALGTGHRDHRQSDERDRLRVDADIRPQRHLLAVQHERLLADRRRDAGSRRRQDRVDIARTAAAPRSRYQRRNFCACTTAAAGTSAPAISRSRTSGSKSSGRGAQPLQMQRGAFRRGDDIGGGCGRAAPPESRSLGRTQRRGDGIHRRQSLGRGAGAEISARRGNAQPGNARVAARRPARPGDRRRPDRPDRDPASRHRPAPGRRRNAPTARDDPGWKRTENCRPATAARRSVSVRTMPQNDAGTRIDPLVSDPSASGTSPPRDRAAGAAGRPARHARRVVRIARRRRHARSRR